MVEFPPRNTPTAVLSPAGRRALRARAHGLQPVVRISHNGLSEAVLAEIERCLAAHELIKVRVHGAGRREREILLAQICERLQAAPVQHIGNILVLFRPGRPPETAEAVAPAGDARRPGGPVQT